MHGSCNLFPHIVQKNRHAVGHPDTYGKAFPVCHHGICNPRLQVIFDDEDLIGMLLDRKIHCLDPELRFEQTFFVRKRFSSKKCFYRKTLENAWFDHFAIHPRSRHLNAPGKASTISEATSECSPLIFAASSPAR